jgi:hypothetical protein
MDRLSEHLTGKPISRVFPIYLVFHQGKLRGFFQATVQTVIYPAIHPETMGPKEYVKIMKSLISEIKRATGNPIFMVCSRADSLGETTLKKLRVKKAEESAYVYDED